MTSYTRYASGEQEIDLMGSNSITWKYQKGSPASFTLTDAGVSGVDINLAINSTLTDTGSVIGINLANANTWTALQTFDNEISIGGATYAIATLASGQYVYYNGTNWVNVTPIVGTTLTETAGQMAINLANANTWTGAQDFSAGATGTTFSASTSITTPISLNSAAQTTVTGTTAGSLICSQPEQGTSYKKVIVYADGYENDSTTAQTYTFPTAFTAVAVITTNSAAIPVTTTSLTALSTAPDTTTAYTGLIVIEGY